MEPDSTKDASLIATVSPGFNFVEAGTRANATVNVTVNARYEESDDSQTSVDALVGGTGQIEAIEDRIFIDGNATVDEQVLDIRDAGSGAAGNVNNRDTVQTYQISPFLTNRLGRYADVETRLTGTQVLIDSNRVSDSTQARFNVDVNSGEEFNKLQWSLGGSVSESFRPDAQDISRWNAELGLTYAINRILAVTGSGGYEDFDDGNAASSFEAPTWDAGIILTPSPNLEARASYGQRNDEDRIDARLNYDVTPRTRITGTITETLTTSQAGLGSDLSFIGVDATTGALIDTRTGLPFNANTSPFTVQDATTRTTTYGAAVSGSRGRNTFTVQLSFQEQKTEAAGQEQDVAQINGTYGRQLKPRLTLNLVGSFQYSDLDDTTPREDFDSSATGTLSYTLFENVSASVSYSYTRRDSDDSTAEFEENAGTISLRATF